MLQSLLKTKESVIRDFTKLNILIFTATVFSILLLITYSNFTKKPSLNSKVIKVTNLSNFAYSNSFLENRFVDYETKNRALIYSRIDINYLDFVYEK